MHPLLLYSLVMSSFSRDFMSLEIDYLKYQHCFNSHSAWFSDGRKSILVDFLFEIYLIKEVKEIGK